MPRLRTAARVLESAFSVAFLVVLVKYGLVLLAPSTGNAVWLCLAGSAAVTLALAIILSRPTRLVVPVALALLLSVLAYLVGLRGWAWTCGFAIALGAVLGVLLGNQRSLFRLRLAPSMSVETHDERILIARSALYGSGVVLAVLAIAGVNLHSVYVLCALLLAALLPLLLVSKRKKP